MNFNECKPIGEGNQWVTSSGTARTLLKPFLNTTKTLLAPQRSADVAQSNAVSPAPKTMTVPYSAGSCDLHLHIPFSKVGSFIECGSCHRKNLISRAWFASSRDFRKEILGRVKAQCFIEVFENRNLFSMRQADTDENCCVSLFFQSLFWNLVSYTT